MIAVILCVAGRSGQVSACGSAVTLSLVTPVLIGGLPGGLRRINGVAMGAVLLSEIENALIVAPVPPNTTTSLSA